MPNNNQEVVITSFFDNPYDINNKTLSYEIPVGGAYIIEELTQVNSDWLAIDGLSAILNKPILADVATSGSYTDLTNKPDLTLKQNSLPTNGTVGQFLAHDMTFKTPTGVNEYSSTALASAWTGTDPSVLALTVTGLLATHKTVLDIDLSSVTFANVDDVQSDYALIYRAVPTDNTLTLYATKKPTKDLNLKVVVLNG